MTSAILAVFGAAVIASFAVGGGIFTPTDPSWRAMQQRGAWRVGMDPSFPPFELLDESGQMAGYDVDLAHAMAARWNLRLELVPIGFDSLLDALQTGQIDSVVSALPYDPRATQNVRYSPPYFDAGIRLAVRNDSPLAGQVIAEADQFSALLANHRVAVEWGSAGDMVGRRLQRADTTLELIPFATPEEAVNALRTDDTVDALLIDNVTLLTVQGQGAAIRAIGPALEANPYVIASPITAPILQREIADALRELEESGRLQELTAQWLR
ncbi:MAG: transporter substrate-binding domain-containing protein [Caldilineaceae bacterium]